MIRRTNWSPLAAIGVILALLVSACGTNQGGGSPTAATSAAPDGSPGASAEATAEASASGTLTVWAMGNEGVLLGTLAEAFMAENPGATVNVTPIDWGVAVDRLQTAIAGNQTPDVSQMGTDMMGQFAATGALEPVPDTFDQSAFFEGAWNTNVVDGTVYGVPWYVETRLLYYRTDIAEAAGITAPPATWDELMAAAQAMKGEGGAEWGISLGTKNWQEYVPFLWSNGGQIMDDQGVFHLNSPEAVEALTFYNSFFDEELTPTTVPEGFDITPAFVSGTHPMFFSGPWHVGLITEAGGADLEGKWALAPMPRKASATSFVGGANLVVYEASPNKDLAWAFVQYLTDPATQVDWYAEATVLPAVQSAWDDPELADDENVAMFGEQLQDTQAQPAIATWSEISAAMNAALEKMTAGDLDPQGAADEMQAEAERIGTGE